jgi:hypothetical protein
MELASNAVPLLSAAFRVGQVAEESRPEVAAAE